MSTSVGQIALNLVVNKNKFNQQMNGIQSTAKKIGATIASAFALKKLVDFGKQCIELSSDLQEVQNVVNVTFPSMTKTVDEFAQSAADAYGLSETMAKKFTGTYGAMAKAFGFTEEAAFEMGSTLTGLAGDVASFYNLTQDEAYTKLKSVFTGETETLKDLGVVMTQNALDAYALANGYGKVTKDMSEAEKVALRYAFVQNQLSAANGDFSRTSDSWANQTKLLKLNLEQLKATIGGTLINAFKPLLQTMNIVIGKFTEFAKVIGDSLGTIFGWTYEESGNIADGLADGADSAGDIASGIGDATGEAKKLKAQLRGIDELNVISSNNESGNSSSAGGSSSGSSSGSNGGGWQKTESIFSDYESELDSLSKLGNQISDKISKSLEKIDWNKVYKKASGFASGLASFLNGLIKPETFATIGKTLANSLNTVMITVDTFLDEFDFKNLGKSITTGISSFFANLDWSTLGSVLSGRFKALCDFITGLFNGIDWSGVPSAIAKAIRDFLTGFDWAGSFSSIGELIATAIIALVDLKEAIALQFENIANDIKDYFVDKFKEAGFDKDKGILENGAAIAVGLLNGILQGLANIGIWLTDNVFGPILDGFLTAFGIKNGRSEKIKGVGSALIKGVLKGLADNISSIIQWFKDIPARIKKAIGDLVVTISTKVEDFKEKVREKWNAVQSWWKSKKALANISAKIDDLKAKLKSKWEAAKSWWNKKQKLKAISLTIQGIVTKLSNVWSKARSWWNKKAKLSNVSANIENISTKLSNTWNKAKTWWKNKPSLKEVSVTISSIKDMLKKAFDSAKEWARNNFKLKFQISYETKNLSGVKKAIVDLFGLKGWPSFQFFDKGGFPEDGWFRAKHGEIMGRFDNGNSVVANNMQITEGISSAVYKGNRENNALIREEIALLKRQNELLTGILEKEVGITSEAIFNSVKKSADSYTKRTGNPAFNY